MSPLGGIEAVGGPLRVLDPAEGWKPDTLLDRATALWRADAIHPSGQRLNDLSGNGHHAQFGSTPNADANDPLILPYKKGDDKYLYLPGSAGNFASTPDVNLLPSNVAHTRSTIGPGWTSNNGIVAPTSAPHPNSLHGFGVRMQHNGNGNLNGGVLGAWSGNRVPVVAGTSYSVSSNPVATVVSSGKTMRIQVGLYFYDANTGTNIVLASWGSNVELGSSPTNVTHTVTAPSGATHVSMFWRFSYTDNTAVTAGDTVVLGDIIIRQGTDPTFVPSTRITGDIDIRAEVAVPRISYSQVGIFHKGGNNNVSTDFSMQFHGTGAVLFAARGIIGQGPSAGNAYIISDGTIPFEDNDRITIRITREVASGAIKFYYLVGGEWVIFSDRVFGPGENLLVSSSNIFAGSRGGLAQMGGNFHWGELRDGIDGPVVARFDPNNSVEPHITVPGGAGETWTINRSESGMKATLVDRPLLLFGGSTYLEVPHHDDLNIEDELAAVVIVFRRLITNTNRHIIGKKLAISNTAPGWLMWASGEGHTYFRTGDGNTGVQVGNATVDRWSGHTLYFAARLDEGLTIISDGVTIGSSSTRNTINNDRPLRIGESVSPDMEFIGAAIFREALTDYEISQVADYLKEVF